MSTQTHIQANKTLDCQGLACPMPIVRTRKAMDELEPGQVIEVQATDKGSLADLKGWAQHTGHHYLGTVHNGELMRHFIRKSSPQELKAEQMHPLTVTGQQLEQKLAANVGLTVLDVREPAEYAFNHISGALSIPLNELELRIGELASDEEIHVVCRTGYRSDLACQLLAGKGFKQVINVEAGMNGWTGSTEQA